MALKSKQFLTDSTKLYARNIGTRGWRNYNVSMSIEAFRNETIVTLYDRQGSDVIQGRNKATYLGP